MPMTPTHNPGQLLWTKAVQAEKTAWKQAQFRPGIRVVFSFAQRFSVPQIQTAISAPSVHDLLTLTTTGSGAAEFVGCFPGDPDDFEEHAETRARQNTIVANLTFHNKLSLVNVQALLGSFHVNVSAFDGDDALIPLDSSNAHCDPNSSVTMSKHLSADVHSTAFNIVFTVPVQSGVIPGTFYIPFTASMELQLGGALVSSVRPVSTSNPALPAPNISMGTHQQVSPNGKWFLIWDPTMTFFLRFQNVKGQPHVKLRDVAEKAFSSDSSQIWCTTKTGFEIRSVPDLKLVLATTSDDLPDDMQDEKLVPTTLGPVVWWFSRRGSTRIRIFEVAKDKRGKRGKMDFCFKTIRIDGESTLKVRASCPAQERWRPQALVWQISPRHSRLICVSASLLQKEKCFKIKYGCVNQGRSLGFSANGSVIQTNDIQRVLPFATLFDVSIPLDHRAAEKYQFVFGMLFRGSAKLWT